MSKLASLSLLVVLAVASLALPVAPAQAQGCPVGAAAPVGCPPPPPPPPPGNNPGSPGDPYAPPDAVAEVVKNMLIACRVSGTPEGLPNDLRFRNIGDVTIPAGTQVYWIVSETKDHGLFVLPQDLPVGKSISDLDVLPRGLPTTDHCLSKIL